MRRLLLEVAVGEHPGELDDAPELHLAPAAAHVRRAQRRAEAARLRAQPFLALGKGLHLLGQGSVRALTLPVERLRLLVEHLQRLRDRLELGARELQEGVVVPLEGV